MIGPSTVSVLVEGFSTAVSLKQYRERTGASLNLVHIQHVFWYCDVGLHAACRSLDLSVGCMHFSTVESREVERPKELRTLLVLHVYHI